MASFLIIVNIMAVWWYDGMVLWWYGGYGGMVVWWSDGMVAWQCNVMLSDVMF